MSAAPPDLCAVGLDEIASLVALPGSVGWQDTRDDWRTLLAGGTAFAHRDGEGSLISSAVCFDFGASLAIGKMIVHPAHQGRGLARALMDRCIGVRRDPQAPISLVATPAGERVYRAIGFREVGRVRKFMSSSVRALSRPARDAEILDEADLPAVCALDRYAHGADRSAVLRARFRQATLRVGLRDGAEGLRGFALVVPQDALSILGPLIAVDPTTTTALLETVLAHVAGRAARIDLSPESPLDPATLAAHGFDLVDGPPQMTLEGVALPGHRGAVAALAMQAIG